MRRLRYHIILLLFGWFFTPQSSTAQNVWGELTIVGNKTGVTQMKAQEARGVFRARNSNWPNKLAVVIALPSSKSTVSEPVARLIYGTKPAAVQKFWLSLVFQGRASPPYFFDTDQELIQFIQKTPGAIGVVSSTTPLPSNLSIISIQQ